MSNNVQQCSFNKVSALPLSEVILPEQSSTLFPLDFSLTTSNVTVHDACKCHSGFTSSVDTLSTVQASEHTELVVFSTLSLNLLLQLTQECQITLTAINAINTRNKQTSYRFNVAVESIDVSRQQLIAFTEAKNIEAALTYKAPLFEQPGLLVMDMDSTTIEIECIDEIAALAGVGEEVSAVTELAMQGKLDFSQSLYQRVGTLKDAPESILADVAKNIPLMSGLESLIHELKQYNWRIAIASGGFTYFADHLKDMLSLDAAHANTLEIIDGKLTGKVLGSVVDAQTKADTLLALSSEYNIPHSQTVAMGDGANDLVMMKAAHLGVAFHAKSIVKEKADTAISHSGLDCMVHWLA